MVTRMQLGEPSSCREIELCCNDVGWCADHPPVSAVPMRPDDKLQELPLLCVREAVGASRLPVRRGHQAAHEACDEDVILPRPPRKQ